MRFTKASFRLIIAWGRRSGISPCELEGNETAFDDTDKEYAINANASRKASKSKRMVPCSDDANVVRSKTKVFTAL